MTSQLNVDTIVDKAGSGGTSIKVEGSNSTYVSEGGTATQSLVQGIAKFWIQHNDGASVADSFNAGSTTDHGTGSYTNAFTNPFRAASAYAVSGLALSLNDKATFINGVTSNAEYAAGSFRYQTGYVANTSGAQTNHDANATSPIAFGDLA